MFKVYTSKEIREIVAELAVLGTELVALRTVADAARVLLDESQAAWYGDGFGVLRVDVGVVNVLAAAVDALDGKPTTARLYVDGGEWGSARTDGKGGGVMVRDDNASEGLRFNWNVPHPLDGGAADGTEDRQE